MIATNALKKHPDKISTMNQAKGNENYCGEKSSDNDSKRSYDTMIQNDSSFLSPNKKLNTKALFVVIPQVISPSASFDSELSTHIKYNETFHENEIAFERRSFYLSNDSIISATKQTDFWKNKIEKKPNIKCRLKSDEITTNDFLQLPGDDINQKYQRKIVRINSLAPVKRASSVVSPCPSPPSPELQNESLTVHGALHLSLPYQLNNSVTTPPHIRGKTIETLSSVRNDSCMKNVKSTDSSLRDLTPLPFTSGHGPVQVDEHWISMLKLIESMNG
mmetsp:Transcript_9341/g.11580  ORF Transcript_9341/g.11580 Transcript_9341/m.11580 type:complete len:276 (-) Transcript_9341:70-897(-)